MMQARGPSVEVLVDCPNCRVEGARVEIVVRGDHEGPHGDHVFAGRCRMCGAADEGGRTVRAGARVWDEAGVRAALTSWAAEEGETDVAAFVRANFGEPDVAAIVARMVAGERVETSFEVVAWLFGGRGGVAGMTPDTAQGSDTRGGTGIPSHPASAGGGPSREKQERGLEVRRRDATRALCAARAADGRQHPAEEPVLVEALAALDLPAPEAGDARVWRPNEIGPVPDPAGTLRWMRAVALADGEADPSEVRLLGAYARAWQVPLDAIAVADPPWSSRLAQAWRKWRSS